MGADPVATAFYNALTVTFPLGERFFIDSVRPYREGAPPALSRDIADFIKQEALHTREHVAFNAQVDAAGYDTAPLVARTRRELGRFDGRSDLRRLGLTIALEHFTALLAHQLLAAPHHMAKAPASVRQLWRWHALEEIEHKAVAFDTFAWVTRAWSPHARWAFRALVMLETTWLFAKAISLNMADLYRQDGLSGLAVWGRTAGYLFGKSGIVAAMSGGWRAWFAPGFHPWQEDDRALIAPVAAEFASLAQAA